MKGRLPLSQWARRHPFGLLVGAVLLLGSLAAFATVEREAHVLAPSDENAQVRFGGALAVGQEFSAPRGLVAVRMPVQSDGHPPGPLILHIRKTYFGEDLRTAIIFRHELDEAVFTFDPLFWSPPEQLVWVLEAPHSPSRSLWAYREQDDAAYAEGEAFVNGKPVAGNFAFTLVRKEFIYHTIFSRVVWESQPWERLSVVVGVLAMFGLGVVRASGVRVRLATQHAVIGLAVASVVFHGFFAQRLPFINDEGAYLQDALQTTTGFWPFRDFLTKGPAYIALVGAWSTIAPSAIASLRLLSALAWGGVVVFGALLARQLHRSGAAQVVTAALLALLPGVNVLTTPLLLQTVSTLFVAAALVCVIRGAQQGKHGWLVSGAGLMAVAYLTRSSSLVAVVVGGLAIIILGARGFRWRALGIYAGVGLIVIGIVAGVALGVMGLERTSVLFNVEAVAVGKLQQARNELALEPLLRRITQEAGILWPAAPWLLSGLVLVPLLTLPRLAYGLRLVVVAAWAVVMYQVLFHLSDMNYLMPGSFPIVRASMLAIVFGIPAVWGMAHLISRRRESEKKARQGHWMILMLVWLVLLGVLYGKWGAFRPSYLIEFLLPASLLAGWAYAEFLAWIRAVSSRVVLHALAGVFIASVMYGTVLVSEHPFAGTLSLDATARMVDLIEQHVPEGTPLFTAQPAFAALSDRPIMFGYSHPGWIRGERVGAIPGELRRLYFADDDAITAYLRDEAQVVAWDRRTMEIYFDGYPDRVVILGDRFELVAEIDNDATEEPFRLYKRKD